MEEYILNTVRAADLDRHFGIAGRARVVSGNGGLPKVVVSAADASGEMYLHGGHVTSWAPREADEVFFLSPNSLWQDGHAIRGGVPVSFPWFADKADHSAAPPHGFVRTKAWNLVSVEPADTGVVITMSTESDEDTRRSWPFDFRLVHRATFGMQLKSELVVTNTGTASFSFEEALHSYFRIGNIETAFVRGLDSIRYIDKTDKRAEKKQIADVRISSETDRVYLNAPQEVELNDPTLKRRLTLAKENSLTTVVWNPWAEKARAMSDLASDAWKDFLCIETTNVSPYSVHVGPREQHTLGSMIRVSTILNG